MSLDNMTGNTVFMFGESDIQGMQYDDDTRIVKSSRY